jgi:hypothetical protein
MGNNRCSGWLLGGGGMRLVAVLLVSLAVAACSAGTDPVSISAPDAPLQEGYLGGGGKGNGNGGAGRTEDGTMTLEQGYLGGGGSGRPIGRPTEETETTTMQ